MNNFISNKISIIVPVYNVEEYISDCIYSISNQIYTDFEVLLINDGSKDNSKSICLDFIAKDSRFIYYEQENKGVSGARNFGIEKAKGEWICFVDPDDSIDKNYLKNFIENIIDDKTLVISDFNRISNSGKQSNFLKYKNKLICLDDSYDVFLNNINYLVGNPFNKLFNLKIILNNNIRFLKEQSLGEDRLFYYDYLSYIDKLKIIDESDYNYYYRENSSISRQHSYKVYQKLIEGENFIFKESNILDLKLKERYTNLFLIYIRAINREKISLNEKVNILNKHSVLIKNEYLLHLDRRSNILIQLFNLKLYRLCFYLLNKFLK